MASDIRVGLIRCDTHGMWFGAQMDDHDPLLLRQPMPVSEEMRYSWQRGGVHYFYYTRYCDPTLMTAPRVDGFRIVKVWDHDRRSAEMFARVFHDRPLVCDTFDQVSDGVDLVFVADCNGDGSDHLMLSTPGIQKGVPTFIDKPLAGSLADAQQILSLAESHRVPLLSLSILQTNPAVARIARRFDALGGPTFASVTCHSTHWAALIHAICIVHHLFGTGVRSVRCLRAPDHKALHLDYGQRPDRPQHGVVINCGVADFRFTEMFVNVFGQEGAVQEIAMDDFNASEGSAAILERVKIMLRTGQVDPLGGEMLNAVAVAEAAREAEHSGNPAVVADVDGAQGVSLPQRHGTANPPVDCRTSRGNENA